MQHNHNDLGDQDNFNLLVYCTVVDYWSEDSWSSNMLALSSWNHEILHYKKVFNYHKWSYIIYFHNWSYIFYFHKWSYSICFKLKFTNDHILFIFSIDHRFFIFTNDHTVYVLNWSSYALEAQVLFGYIVKYVQKRSSWSAKIWSFSIVKYASLCMCTQRANLSKLCNLWYTSVTSTLVDVSWRLGPWRRPPPPPKPHTV